MPNDAFISHNKKDKDFVRKLCDRLEDDGIVVWLDERDISVGDSITQKIEEGLEESSFFIIVLSENSIKSEWVKRELNVTLMRQINSKDITILPVRLELDCEKVPLLLQDIYSVQFSRDRIDNEEYSKLIKPIINKKEADSLLEMQESFYEDVEHIDIVRRKDKPTGKEVKMILDLIKEEPYHRYFFKNVESITWLKILKSSGYFSPSEDLNPTETGDGYYSTPFWNVLNYLEKISNQIDKPGNEEYIGELLEIIKNVSNYKDSNGEHIDNNHTWLYFTRILINIPNNRISLEIIDLISIWINSKFGSRFIGEDIAVKLLLKFLPENPTGDDIEKAQRIIDLITKYKWGKETKLFGKEEEVPKTIMNLDDLTSAFLHNKIAKKIGEKCSDSILFIIADKLKEILTRTNSPYYIETGYNNGLYRLTVSLEKDFEFNCSIDFIKEDKPLAERLVEQLTGKPAEEKEKIYDFKIESCSDSNAFSTEIEKNISNTNIPDEIKKEFYKKTGELYEGVFDDRSAFWHERITCYGDSMLRDSKRFFAFVLTEIVCAKVETDRSTFDNIYKQFTGEKYRFLFYKRLLLFIIGKFFESFRDKFWELVQIKIGEQIFDGYEFERDLYALLKNNCKKLNTEEKELFKKIIEKGPVDYPSDENKDRYLNYWKQKWYSALKEDAEFKSLYEKEKKISGRDIDLSYRKPSSSFTSRPMASPISKGELLDKTNVELAELARTLKTKQLPNGFSSDRLPEELRWAAKEKPGKFVNNLDPFLNTGCDFVYSVLSGVLEALRLETTEIFTEIDWGKLFAFMKRYIDRDEFWQDKLGVNFSSFNENHESVVGIIANLIEAGTKTDDLAFDKKYNEVAKEIIFLLLERLKIEKVDSVEDPVSYVLNSTIGKTITALILLSLRIARLEKKQDKDRKLIWAADLKRNYEKLIQDEVFHAYVLFGQYIGFFYYHLDESWTEQKIQDFESIKDGQLWSGFMAGYLFGNRVYDALFKLMKPHYFRSLSYTFNDNDARIHLSKHIGLGYLYGLDGFSQDDLFGTILIERKYNKVKEIVNYFWNQRDNIIGPNTEIEFSKKMRNKIIELWERLYSEFKDNTSFADEERELLSSLALLTTFLHELNDRNFEWLMLSAPYVDHRYNYSFFIEYLDRLKDKGNRKNNARYLAKIFLKMLESFEPDFKPEHIRSIIEFIYLTEGEETSIMANEICNEYGKRGSDLLRDLYEQYSKR